MRYLGVDLAWSKNNFSALSILEDNILIQTVYLKSDDDILNYILEIKPDKIGVDAPLEVLNSSGTRDIENSFLKDFAKYKLGVYPVNKSIMDRLYGGNRAEELFKKLQNYQLRINLFEVYPHATILRCFTKDKVLPYKRKKGRSSPFIREQLNIFQNYIEDVIIDFNRYDVDNCMVKDLKVIEDKLDSIVCAYTLYRGDTVGYNDYDKLLIVPIQ